MIHDVGYSWAGPGIVILCTVILVYVKDDSGYPNRGAAGQQPSLFLQCSRLCRRFLSGVAGVVL